MLDFQRRDTTLTLAQGLAEYYASCDGLVSGRGLSPRAREFFRCHDAAHVVFGCSTDLLDEAAVKIWSFFGTTGGLGLLRDYRLPEAQEIYETLEVGEIARVALRSIVLVPRVLAACWRMSERWPWAEFEPYLDEPLVEIRRDFAILPVQDESSAAAISRT